MVAAMRYFVLAILLASHVAFADNITQATSGPKQESWGLFLRNQLTNPYEWLTDSILSAIFDVSAGDYTRRLGKNPNAKLIIRDISKIFGLSANVFWGNEVAGIGYYYDQSHLWSHGSKIITKLLFYRFLINTCGFTPDIASIWANQPGDTVGRFGLIAGQARTNTHNTDPFPIFFWQNFDSKWATDTIAQQLPNLPIMYVMGEVAKYYTVGDKLQLAMLWLLPRFLSNDVVVGQIYSENTQGITSRLSKARIYVVMLIAFSAEKLVFNFVFPPISRLMMATGTAIGASIKAFIPTFSAVTTQERDEV